MTTPCEIYIKDLIHEEGPIPLHRFMEIALFHETYGYYKQNRAIIGAEGDFVTSPEISQMFGELIGLWAYDLWLQLGSPDDCDIIELGPGRGTLMSDFLRATKNFPFFHKSLTVHLIETNPLLKSQQQEALAPYPFCEWHPSIQDLETQSHTPAIVIANEFFDVFPVDQFIFSGGKWRQRFVGLEEDRLAYVDVETTIPLPQGKEDRVIEISTRAEDYLKSVGTHIDRGALLVVDYGYGHGLGDSLQALHHKRPCHLLEYAGDADITAHVNFHAFSNLLEKEGFKTHGPVTQAQFLSSLGIRDRAFQLKQNAAPEQTAGIEAALQRLTHHQQMGALFKVLCATSDNLHPKGFPHDASFRAL